MEIRGGGGVGRGGGGGDFSAARCWSIDPAREIGTHHGVRTGHTKILEDSIFIPGPTATLPCDSYIYALTDTKTTRFSGEHSAYIVDS